MLILVVVLGLVLVVVSLWYCVWISTESAGYRGMTAIEAPRLNARRRRAWNFMAISSIHVGYLYSAQFSLVTKPKESEYKKTKDLLIHNQENRPLFKPVSYIPESYSTIRGV